MRPSEAPFDPFSAVAAYIFRVPTFGLLLCLAAATLLVVTLSGRPSLYPVGAPFARTLGAGVLLVAPALAALGAAIYFRRTALTRRAAVTIAGWGMAAVVFAATVILSLTFGLLYRIVRQRSENVLVAIAVTGVAVAGSSIHWLARPHLATLLLAVLFLGILESRSRFRR